MQPVRTAAEHLADPKLALDIPAASLTQEASDALQGHQAVEDSVRMRPLTVLALHQSPFFSAPRSLGDADVASVPAKCGDKLRYVVKLQSGRARRAKYSKSMQTR